MSNNPPKNHHFVPQHFLKAWQSSDGKIYRHRFIQHTGKFESKEVAIRRTASVDDLYRVQFPDGSFEIESSLVTPEIDEAGYKIIEKIRIGSLSQWTKTNKKSLAIYLTCLEARHPDVIEEMNVGAELEELRTQMKEDGFARDKSVDEVVDYFQSSPSIGLIAFAYFLQNEKTPLLAQPFSDGILSANVREYTFSSDALICSSYPTSRWGDYLNDFLFVVAVSPKKAIVYSTSSDVDVFGYIPEIARINLINLYSLSKANLAYFKDTSKSKFIKQHLGWATKLKDLNAQKDYVAKFIQGELIQASYEQK